MNDKYSWEKDAYERKLDLAVTAIWGVILVSLTVFWGGFFLLVWKIADKIL